MGAKYGQHLLINQHAKERIVSSTSPTKDDTFLEIGPGKGSLTGILLLRVGQLVAVEIDPDMINNLKLKWGSQPHFKLIEASILDVSFEELFKDSKSEIKVVGNLPYNLTSPILRKLCAWNGWSEAVVMVQKEVGDRLTAKVDSQDYSALTVGVNLHCQIQPIFNLSPSSFDPKPKVESSVIKLIRRKTPLTESPDEVTKVIQAGFQQRRKTILNSFSHGLSIPKANVQKVLEELSLSPQLRAQNLAPEIFVQLTHKFSKIKNHD